MSNKNLSASKHLYVLLVVFCNGTVGPKVKLLSPFYANTVYSIHNGTRKKDGYQTFPYRQVKLESLAPQRNPKKKMPLAELLVYDTKRFCAREK